MEKVRRDLVELIIAVETVGPQDVFIEKLINGIKSGWNQHMMYQYGEAARRAEEKKKK
jgi:hypothetical protein